VRTDAYARVAWALGVSDTRRDDQANAQSAIDAVRRLSLAVGMPGSLTELGCTEALLPALTEDALADEVIVNTPRFPDQPELQALLRAVL
jgi:alcohol dehydrogenase